VKVAFLVVIVACGGSLATTKESGPQAVSSGDPHRAVGLGEWCRTLAQLMCIRAGSCIGSIEVASTCTDQAMAACLSGRAEETPSGHDGGELDACVGVFQNAPCDGYMAIVSSHAECHARGPEAATP